MMVIGRIAVIGLALGGVVLDRTVRDALRPTSVGLWLRGAGR